MNNVLGAGGWSRAPDSTDIVIPNAQRKWRYNTSPQGSFGANTLVYIINDQIDFGTITQGTSLGAVCVYWDSTNGSNKQDITDRVLWWDDSQVNSAVTSTGSNKWGASGVDNDCVGMEALISTPNAYVMGIGTQEMQANAQSWQSGSSDFALRLYQTGGSGISGPNSMNTISQVDAAYPRATAQAGGDVPDIVLTSGKREFEWDPGVSTYNWNYIVDPGGASMSFGLVAAGQTLDAVVLFNQDTGALWYWDAAFLDVTLGNDATVTYGPSAAFIMFAYRAT